MRKLISRTLMFAGFTVGAVPGVVLIILSWPDLVSHIDDNHGLKHFPQFFVMAGGIWFLVAWPFFWIAGKIFPESGESPTPPPDRMRPT
jgi:hypothetical protein